MSTENNAVTRGNRKGLSNKIRFEVFKRDAFKCQYCGKSAPEVMLEVDHIIPVSKSGNNDLINLITSCRDCNSGKSNRQLDDNSVLIKQRNQLEEINERREQIEMMAQWRQELEKIKEQQVDIIDDILKNKTGSSFSAYGREGVKGTLRKYDLNFVCECFDVAFNRYLRTGKDGRFTHDSIENAIKKWHSICKYKHREISNPDLGELNLIVNWFNKYKNTSNKIRHVIYDAVKMGYDAGVPFESIWTAAKKSNTVYQLENSLREYIA